ncbi:MAG TPA: choice-of-anchor M domain-containing protein [Solirubrobacteraceae bacterium]|nr:choice-of-anchor M domain-containing protein [Solirubrobacteraceae bacterium]
MGRVRNSAIVIAIAFGVVAPAADAAVVLEQGHADYGVRVVDGTVRSQVKDGTSGSVVWREPADVVVRLTATARTTVPADAAYSFLGAPGARTWLIPQTQKADVVWLGWNTEELSGGQASGTVGWSLDAVDGPGSVAVFVTDTFGRPRVLMHSGDGLPDRHEIALGTHAHGNWAFSQPGTYALTFTHHVQTADGPQTDTDRLVVEVADTPASGGGGGGSGGGAGGGGAGGGAGGGGAGTGGGSSGGGTTDGGRPTGDGPGKEPAAATPNAAVVGRSVRLRANRTVGVRVRCGATSGVCRGKVVLRTSARVRHAGKRQRLTLGSRSYRIAAGRTATVRVKVSRAAARTLRQRRTTSVAATVTRERGTSARVKVRLTAR